MYDSTQAWILELLSEFIFYKMLPLSTLPSKGKFLIINNLQSRHQPQNHSLRKYLG